MRSVARPQNEARRLAVLYSLGILDTWPDVEFDQITADARFLCDAPISLVTLIDEHRQWFKSHPGLEISETPRDTAFCAHTIVNDGLFVVPDTRADLRFFDNPMVADYPKARFYAGYPIHAPTGECLGALSVIDTKPRLPEALNIKALTSLGQRTELRLLVDAKSEPDPETKIPNRAMFLERGKQMLDQRDATATLVLYVYQLAVSDHERDTSVRRISATAARKFVATLRQAYGKAALYGRIGPNTFAVLAAEPPNHDSFGSVQDMESKSRDSSLRIARGYPSLSTVVDVGWVYDVDGDREPFSELLVAGCAEALLAARLRKALSSTEMTSEDAELLHSFLRSSRTLGSAFPFVRWDGEASRPRSGRILLRNRNDNSAAFAVSPVVLLAYLSSPGSTRRDIAKRIDNLIAGFAADGIESDSISLSDIIDLIRIGPKRES